MTTLTNLTAVVTSLIVTSYTTNVVSTDNRRVVEQYIVDGMDLSVREVPTGCPTERYEQVTITEHKHAEVTLTNGVVLRQELTNRIVSDRIRTWKLIQTEEFVGEKDAPKLELQGWVYAQDMRVTNDIITFNPTNDALWKIATTTNIIVNPPPWGGTFTPNNDTEKP